ncbi:hypothetical protein [Streptomyces sp. NPDC057301]|uniref:hypothetical protein n=1 Tax=Streptomyces sp. NPDC057301 TaxID=3346093 RepID=UPI003631390D
MDGTTILSILAIAGVVSVLLYAVKGLLEQLIEVIVSATRARDAWRRFRQPEMPESVSYQVLAEGNRVTDGVPQQNPTSTPHAAQGR